MDRNILYIYIASVENETDRIVSFLLSLRTLVLIIFRYRCLIFLDYFFIPLVAISESIEFAPESRV